MKFFPQKNTELTVQLPLANVREALSRSVSPKRQKTASSPEYLPFYGSIDGTGFKITPNSGHRDGYTPVVSGELTEVTESKPSSGERDGFSRVYTRLDLNMRLNPLASFFSVLWAVLCVIAFGFAIWRCFANGFENNWWLLLIGPVLLLVERLLCVILFASSSRKSVKELKKLFSGD